MRFFDLLRMSGSSLWKRKVRTVLTVLGVVIGVASIVVMVSLGLGLKQMEMEQMESYGGLTTINVYESYDKFDSGGTDHLLSDSLAEQISAMEHVELVAPVLRYGIVAKCGQLTNYFSVQALPPKALEYQKYEVGEGKLPTDPEKLEFFYGNQVIMDFYNEKANNNFYGNDTPPDINLMEDTIFYIFDRDKYMQSQNSPEEGQTAVSAPKKYIIPTCGVMAGGVMDYNNGCWEVFCNIDALKSSLRKMFKNKVIPGQPATKGGRPYKEFFYDQFYVYVDKLDNVMDVQQQIIDLGYEAYSNAEWIQSEQNTLGYIQAVLGGIGAVSLLVAAIGITNTMMMSIYERTKEIGVMKVLGCNLGDIRSLFLFEAAFIGLLGGIIGLGLSYGISTLLNKVLNLAGALGMEGGNISLIPPWLAAMSLVFAVVVGMAAGFFPSLRAMRLSPLAAIRNE